MKVATHIVAAEASWFAAAVLFDLESSGACIVAAAVGGILPDLDYPDSWVGYQARGISKWIHRKAGHRGICHSLAALLVFALAVWLINARATLSYSWDGWWWIAATIGFWSHLFSDMLTLGGVQLFAPFSNVWCIFPGRDEYRIISGGPRERGYLVICLLVFALMWPISGVGLTGMLYGMGKEESAVGRVVEVTDGDTLKVALTGGAEETIRLLGVDTPETVDPDEEVGCFGPEASAATKDALRPGQEVRVVLSAMGDKQDAYGRMIAYVYPTASGGKIEESWNYKLINQGFARGTTFSHEHKRLFDDVIEEAQSQGLGLWGECEE